MWRKEALWSMRGIIVRWQPAQSPPPQAPWRGVIEKHGNSYEAETQPPLFFNSKKGIEAL